jgi:hypothetical protein
MLALEDDAFKFCLDEMPIVAIYTLFVVTGGLESAWSRRARQFMSARAWEMVEEDYPDMDAEPIKAEDAADCIANLPVVMEQQPWPKDESQLSPDELDNWEEEMEALFNSENSPQK